MKDFGTGLKIMVGRDTNGRAVPLKLDENGYLYIHTIDSDYSYVTDDNDEKVLRTVDAAPYLVEYGHYDEANTEKLLLFGYSKSVLDENNARKYARLTNMSDDTAIILSPTAGSPNGIVLFPKDSYEMSVPKGTLYRGEVFGTAVVDPTLTISSFTQGGIMYGSFSESTRRVHTDKIDVNAGDAISLKIADSSNFRIRNVYGWRPNNVNYNYLLDDTTVTEWSGVIPENVGKIAISLCRVDPDEDCLAADVNTSILYYVGGTPLMILEGM